MPERSRKKKPTDVNALAAAILREATDPDAPEEKPAKNAAAAELGRRGGLKGGKARAAKMTPAQRLRVADGQWSIERLVGLLDSKIPVSN